MKLSSYCISLIRILAVTCVILCLPGNSAYGNNDSVLVNISLVSAHRITQGEPILLKYNIVNQNDSNALIRIGVDKTEWYSLSLFDANDKRVVPLTNVAVSHLGLSAAPSRYVEAGKTIEDYIVVTRYFGDLRPGRYTLSVHVNLPVASIDSEAKGIPLDAYSHSGTVVTQDLTYKIDIAPIDIARLLNTAETLRTAYTKQRSGGQAAFLLDELFSMPEAQASASWMALANDTYMDAESIAEELLRVHTATAADILTRMLQKQNLSPDETAAISRDLNEMYNTSDTKLKAHISAIAASLGISMPEKVAIPNVTD